MINYYKKKGEKGQIPKEEGNKEDVNMIINASIEKK